MKLRNTARIAVTAGLCLSMTLGGAPTAALAEEVAQANESTTTEQAATVDEQKADAAAENRGFSDRKVTYKFVTKDGKPAGIRPVKKQVSWFENGKYNNGEDLASGLVPDDFEYVSADAKSPFCVVVVVKAKAPKTVTVTVKYWDENGVDADGNTTGAEVPGAVQTHTLEIGKAYGDIFGSVPDTGYELEGHQTLGTPNGEKVTSQSIVQGDATVYVHVKRKTVEPNPDPEPENRAVAVHFYDRAEQKYIGEGLSVELNDATFNGGAKADINTIQELQTWIQSWNMQPNGYTFDDDAKMGDQVVTDKGTAIAKNAKDVTFYVSAKSDPKPDPEARQVNVKFYDRAKNEYVGGTLEDVKLDGAEFNGGAKADINTIQELQTWIQSWNMQPNGYTFDDDAKMGDQVVTDKGTAIAKNAKDVTFYVSAKSDPKPDPEAKYYTVTFKDQFNETTSAVKVKEGETVAQPEDPTLAGYEFAGWSTDAKDYVEYDFSTPVTKDVTLYASYIKKTDDGKDEGTTKPETKPEDQKKDEAKKDEAKKDDKALPQTGDSSAAVVAGVAAAGVAVAVAGVTLKRRQNN